MREYRNHILLMALLSGLVACGGGGGSDAPSSANPPPVVEPTTEPEPQPEVTAPSVPETDDTSQQGTRYQAEDQFISGAVTKSESYVGGFKKAGDRIIFSVNSNSANTSAITIRYVNIATTEQPLALYLNGLKIQDVKFPSTGDATWASHSINLALRAGVNTVSLQADNQENGDVFVGSLYVANGAEMPEQGKGAVYTTFEAELQNTNAEVLAFDTTYKTLASEASGRRAVQLKNTGDYVELSSEAAASGLVLRYAIPDSASGEGTVSTLGLYVNGERQDLAVTSKYAWVYGAFPYSNNPSDGEAHRFYDESAYHVSIPAGATVRLQKDAQDTAAYYTLDLIELEQVPAPIEQPEGYINLAEAPYLADTSGTADATSLLNEAINDAKSAGTGVYMPAGQYSITNRVSLNGVHIQGAGIWHTRIMGRNGKGGFFATGSNTRLTDFKIIGDATSRRDSEDHAAIEGNFGTNSLVQNIWVEHMKVGAWIAKGTDGLLMINGRVRDTYADGFNFHQGVLRSQVSHFNVRNSGDDAFAMWSENGTSATNTANVFSYNTAQLPMLANGFAIYGGDSNKLLNNIALDTVVSSAGIALSHRFNPKPFSGTTVVANNSLYRTGGWDYGWNTSFGALWVFTDGTPITGAIKIDHLTIKDAVYDGVLVSYEQAVDALQLSNSQIDGAGSMGIKLAVAEGELTLENVTVANTTDVALDNWGMNITEEGSNSGF